MRMPRFRVRTMMVGMVGVALALTVARLAQTASERLEVADSYARQANIYRKSAATDEMLLLEPNAEATRQTKINSMDRYSRLAAYYSDLEAHYRRTARYPWLPVAPAPPEPE